MELVIIVVLSVLVGAGRFTVPGHGLTYAGSYEAFAHIWVGALIVLATQKGTRWPAIIALVVLTGIEIVKFLTQ
jgi:hypothetical protein